MDESRKIWMATWAIHKNLSFEEMKYCDYLYGYEIEAESIWEYVEEYEAIGSIAFRDKYKEYKLFP